MRLQGAQPEVELLWSYYFHIGVYESVVEVKTNNKNVVEVK